MLGLNQLFEIRRSGRKPAFVHVELEERPGTRAAQRDASWPVPIVLIDPSANVERSDLRPFVGLSTAVFGTDPKRVQAVCQALTDAGANPLGYWTSNETWGEDLSLVYPEPSTEAA